MPFEKGACLLADPTYDTPKTILTTFKFPQKEKNSLEKAHTTIHYVDGKLVAWIDGFFSPEEGKLLAEDALHRSFSRKIYGSVRAIEEGEEGAASFTAKEKWLFFHQPLPPIARLFAFFGEMGTALQAEASTIPWELDNGKALSPALAANLVKRQSEASEKLGIHADYEMEKGLPFLIPSLFDTGYHPRAFVNGEENRPYLLSAILYVAPASFNPADGLGTLFFPQEGPPLCCRAEPMRLALFEGDIPHTIERGSTPSFRLSYVFKLLFNPQKKGALKSAYANWLAIRD